jgi:hypothetical protein
MARKRRKQAEPEPKAVSLHPLDPTEALADLMKVKPELKHRERHRHEKQPKKR